MERTSKRNWRLTSLLIAILLVLVGILSWFFSSDPSLRLLLGREWRKLTRESRRILGWQKGEISPEEKRIREEVILKKMREASAYQDWRFFAPEYPRLKKLESLSEEERRKALKDSPEFNEIEKELKEYLKKRENLLNIEPSIPPLKDEVNPISLRDRGAERAIERLLSKKEKGAPEKALEENLLLGIKGPLAARKIVEKPQPPQVKVRTEGEIELTFWVLPDGRVDRVIPSIKGDTELERIAIQYLKEWRFVPLPKDEPQVEQWGVIPIKFKLQ
ncbi:MAG: energy transducer TonB [Thermodesulfobacteriota bacterium]